MKLEQETLDVVLRDLELLGAAVGHAYRRVATGASPRPDLILALIASERAQAGLFQLLSEAV